MMKAQKTIVIALISLLAGGLMAFSKKDKDAPKLPKLVAKEFGFVPGGDVLVDNDTLVCDAFFMSKYEVSNAQYADFLKDLAAQGKTSEFENSQVAEANWKEQVKYGEPYANYYFTHAAYANYPVVNVDMQGAQNYCRWLEEKLNATADDGVTYTVRLPKREEWLRAASPDRLGMVYSWGGPRLQNKLGQVLCNFRYIGAENVYLDPETNTYQVKNEFVTYMGVPGSLNDNADVTAPVQSYAPNSCGIYNLNGNVAEITADGFACGGSWNSAGYDVRNDSALPFEKSSPFVGFRPLIVANVN